MGYKDHLNVCVEPSLILDAEMIWVKLYLSNKKPFYTCVHFIAHLIITYTHLLNLMNHCKNYVQVNQLSPGS